MVKVPSATFSSWPFNVTMLTALIAQNKVYYFMCRTRYIAFPISPQRLIWAAHRRSLEMFLRVLFTTCIYAESHVCYDSMMFLLY